MDIKLPEPKIKHFVDWCIARGGNVANTGFKAFSPMFPSYCNPSIYYDPTIDRFRLVQRTVSYTLHASTGDNWSEYGPLHYIIPQERYNWLETRNYYGETADPMSGNWNFREIQMLPRQQQWTFHGLEDARIYSENGDILAIGVRRDDNPTGVGRMNAVSLSITDQEVKEEKTVKIKAPGDDTAYCIKNQSIITDLPHCLIDTFNPLHIIHWDTCGRVETVVKKDKVKGLADSTYDMYRGSSQTIPFNGGHLTIVHTCTLYYTGNNRKFARYLHQFIEYDKHWNIKRTSPLFSFNDFYVEFCCGLTQKDDNLYISFALQDNCSFILQTTISDINTFLDGATDTMGTSIWSSTPDLDIMYETAMDYYRRKDYAGAYTWFSRIVDLTDGSIRLNYNSRFMMARCVADMGHRDSSELGLWYRCIDSDPTRREGYYALSMYYHCRGNHAAAEHYLHEALLYTNSLPLVYYDIAGLENIYRWVMKESPHYELIQDHSLNPRKVF